MATCLDVLVIPDTSGYRAPVGGRGRILIPASVRRVPGGFWVGAACTVPGLALDWLLGTSTRLSVRHTSRKSAGPELPDLDWARWSANSVPQDLAERARYIIARPRDTRRRRFQLAITDNSGRVRAFAKFTRNPPTRLAQEVRARLRQSSPRGFETPKPLSEGEVDGWHFTVDEALIHQFHRPATLRPLQRRELVNEYQAAFADLVPSSERLVHGDFGPWNVRRTAHDRILVFDWEDVAAGPEAADELWHSINTELVRASRGRNSHPEGIRESLAHHSDGNVATAASFWLERLDRPEPTEVEGEAVQGRGADLLARQRQALQALTESSLTR